MFTPDVAGVTVAVGLLTSYGFFATSRRARRHADSLEFARRLGPGVALPRVDRAEASGLVDRVLGPAGLWVQGMTLRAGVPWTVAQVAGWSVALGAGGATAGALLRGGAWTLAGAMLGAAPLLWLLRRASTLDAMVTAQLPDAIDLMTRALRCGHALPDAMRLVATESEEPLATVFGAVAEENGLGLELRDCFDSMLRRVPHNFEMRLFVSCVLLNRETGGNLVEILESVAATIRERAVFVEKVASMTTEVRTSASVLASMPFLAGGTLMFVSPAYIRPMIGDPIGQQFLLGAGLLMLCGLALMGRVATVEAE